MSVALSALITELDRRFAEVDFTTALEVSISTFNHGSFTSVGGYDFRMLREFGPLTGLGAQLSGLVQVAKRYKVGSSGMKPQKIKIINVLEFYERQGRGRKPKLVLLIEQKTSGKADADAE